MTDEIPDLVDKLGREGSNRPEETAAQYSEPVSSLDKFSQKWESAINSCTDSLTERLTTSYPSLSEPPITRTKTPPDISPKVENQFEELHEKLDRQRQKTVKWRRKTWVYRGITFGFTILFLYLKLNVGNYFW